MPHRAAASHLWLLLLLEMLGTLNQALPKPRPMETVIVPITAD